MVVRHGKEVERREERLGKLEDLVWDPVSRSGAGCQEVAPDEIQQISGFRKVVGACPFCSEFLQTSHDFPAAEAGVSSSCRFKSECCCSSSRSSFAAIEKSSQLPAGDQIRLYNSKRNNKSSACFSTTCPRFPAQMVLYRFLFIFLGLKTAGVPGVGSITSVGRQRLRS